MIMRNPYHLQTIDIMRLTLPQKAWLSAHQKLFDTDQRLLTQHELTLWHDAINKIQSCAVNYKAEIC